MVENLNIVFGYLKFFVQETWWFFFWLALLVTFKSAWLYWRNLIYKRDWNSKMVLLELNIPREIQKNARAMAQVLRSIHTLGNAPGDIKEKYIEGMIPGWFSFEMVSFGGEVHFYVRCAGNKKDLVKSAFLSYYQDLEIVEVDDYVDRLPADSNALQREGYKMYATELILNKPAIYPIKTFLDFEVPDEDIQLVDPISSFLEILGNIKSDEFVGLQFNASPGGFDWADEFTPLLEDLRSSKQGDAPAAPGEFTEFAMKSPGQIKTLKAVEEKMSESIFNTVPRIVYISPKEVYFDGFARQGLMGAFSQYGTLDMNSFGNNWSADIRTQIWSSPYIAPGYRGKKRQKRIYEAFITRDMPTNEWFGKILSPRSYSKPIILSVSEMATLFHPPTSVVLTAPHMPRIDSRKAGPPAGLPIFDNEDQLGKFT